MKEFRNCYKLIIFLLFFCFKTPAQKIIFQPSNADWNSRVRNESVWKKGLPDEISSINYFTTNTAIDTLSWESKTMFYFKTKAKNHKVTLVADGLSPYSKIYINQKFVCSIKSSMMTKRIEVGEYLISNQKNEVLISFPSPLLEAKKEYQKDSIRYPSDNEESKMKISQFLRIPPVCFGWDIAEKRLPSRMGKGIRLEENSDMKIEELYVNTERIQNDTAYLKIQIELNLFTTTTSASANLIISSPDGKKIQLPFWLESKNGKFDTLISLPISHPQLWWPNGLYQQFQNVKPQIYSAKLIVYDIQKKVVTEKIQDFGIRTIELVQEVDSFGQSFYFQVNGQKTVMKGANYVPDYSDANEAKWKSLIHKISIANFNKLRIWGGGTYLSERQMKDCDERGILIWQDFPFAGTMYPSDSSFLDGLKEEASMQVKEKRQHPSLALWCGNNEIDVAWKNWGWQQTYDLHGRDSIQLKHGYDTIFSELLPDIVRHVDCKTPYIHTSPLSNWGNANDFLSGDNHFWGVWHGEYPVSSYTRFIPRFMSEFGLPSLPSIAAIQKYFSLKSGNTNDSALASRLRSYKGIRLIEKYIADEYGKPKDLKSFVWLSQLVQANALQSAILAHRSAKPFCMGTLFWQLNDAWPGITWSAIDYDGNEKIAFESGRKSFESLVFTVIARHNTIQLLAVSDLIKDTSVKFHLTFFTKNGKCVLDTALNKIIPKESSSVVYEKTLNKASNDTLFACTISVESKSETAEQVIFFQPSKMMKNQKSELIVNHKNDRIEIYSTQPEKDVLIVDTKNQQVLHHLQFLSPKKAHRIKMSRQQYLNCQIISWKDLIEKE